MANTPGEYWKNDLLLCFNQQKKKTIFPDKGLPEKL